MFDKETIQKIANLDLTEAKKKSTVISMDQFDQAMVEYTKYTCKLQRVIPAYENIKEFGMTHSICEIYKDLIWNELEFDISPYENAPYVQLEYCIEGLAESIRKIYQVLRSIIWKIKEYLTVDGFIAIWLNKCQNANLQVHNMIDLLNKVKSTVDYRKFMGIELETYEQKIFDTRRDALISMVSSITGITEKTDQKTAWPQFVQAHSTDMKILRLTIGTPTDSNALVNNGYLDIVKANTSVLGWKTDLVLQEGSSLIPLLNEGLRIKSKLNMFERMIAQSERNISDVLTGKKEPDVVRDEDSIRNMHMYYKMIDCIFNLIKDLADRWLQIGRTYLACCEVQA